MARYDEGQEPVQMPAIMHSLFSRQVVPSFIVDVSDFVAEKMAAIRAHASQFYRAESNEPSTRISDPAFLVQIEDRMRYFGSLIGVAGGEPVFLRGGPERKEPGAPFTQAMKNYFLGKKTGGKPPFPP